MIKKNALKTSKPKENVEKLKPINSSIGKFVVLVSIFYGMYLRHHLC